ncbi:MAG: hypothetical protein BMS9Abin07_0858 [Acidimicrobiia bacterium]|nr:MAG: hypothetical protein BMS9Abin07_0858 [Acidimicrobiia bacterium]
MPSNTFDRSLRVGRSAEDCWQVLTDVQRVAGWVSVVSNVDEIEPLSTYSAVLTDSFGPFSLNADIGVEVLDVEQDRSIHFKGSGKDRQVRTSITLEAWMELEPEESGTTIHVHGKWNVLGTVATMGGGTISKKADNIVDEFFVAAKAELD